MGRLIGPCTLRLAALVHFHYLAVVVGSDGKERQQEPESESNMGSILGIIAITVVVLLALCCTRAYYGWKRSLAAGGRFSSTDVLLSSNDFNVVLESLCHR